MPFTYDYPRPSVTTDILIFSGKGDETKILLIQRGKDPFKGWWALPGGFLDMDEELDECARRELKEETGLSGIELKQLFTVGDVGRDPRGRTISVMFYGFAYHRSDKVQAGDDARAVQWFSVKNLPDLAFDHILIIERAFADLAL